LCRPRHAALLASERSGGTKKGDPVRPARRALRVSRDRKAPKGPKARKEARGEKDPPGLGGR
jgi:hypothetical protein